MDEGKKMLGIFLVVIIFIVGLGLFIGKQRTDKAGIATHGGSLENVLFPDRPVPTEKVWKETASNSTAGGTEKKGGLSVIIEKNKNSAQGKVATPTPGQKKTTTTKKVTAKKPTVAQKKAEAKKTADTKKTTEAKKSATTTKKVVAKPTTVAQKTNTTSTVKNTSKVIVAQKLPSDGWDATSGTYYPDNVGSTEQTIQTDSISANTIHADTIPETGVPLTFWFMAFSGLLSGVALKLKTA